MYTVSVVDTTTVISIHKNLFDTQFASFLRIWSQGGNFVFAESKQTLTQ